VVAAVPQAQRFEAGVEPSLLCIEQAVEKDDRGLDFGIAEGRSRNGD